MDEKKDNLELNDITINKKLLNIVTWSTISVVLIIFIIEMIVIF